MKTASRKLHLRFKNRTRAGARKWKRVTAARRACTIHPAKCAENYDSIYETASDPGYIDEPVIRVEPAASETLYYHRNQQYSVTALTSSIGAVVERYAYSAYGEPKFLSGTGTVLTDSVKDNRYTYTGREWDQAIGLYNYRARMYDAESGRFCGRDPILYDGGKTLYSLVSGSVNVGSSVRQVNAPVLMKIIIFCSLKKSARTYAMAVVAPIRKEAE